MVINRRLRSSLQGEDSSDVNSTRQTERDCPIAAWYGVLVLPAGKEIPLHEAHGEITVQCLEGRISFTAESKTQQLSPGQLLYLRIHDPNQIKEPI
jgi:quercetin dioxygenase-like cupin family protein